MGRDSTGKGNTVEENDNVNEITPLMTHQQLKQSKKGLNSFDSTIINYLRAELYVILMIADMKSNDVDLCALYFGSEPRL